MNPNYPPTAVVTEHRLWNQHNLIWAVLIGLGIIFIEFVVVFVLELTMSNLILLSFVLMIFYASILFFLLEPHLLREISNTEVRIVEKPVIKEIVRIVEKPVMRKVYIKSPVSVKKKKKLVIPKYSYLGSTEEKTYHKRGCRFSKLIKRKYKVSNNKRVYFMNHKYKPCKVCKPNRN